MMREILFRAKRLDNGEWVEGIPLTYGDGVFISSGELLNNDGRDWRIKCHEIAPSTFCQFTGLRDKNGERIWEGDRVQDDSGAILEVFWVHSAFMVRGGFIRGGESLWIYASESTRISSIHDGEV